MLDDKTTLNIVFIIGALGSLIVQIINAWRAPTKKDTNEIRDNTNGNLAKLKQELAVKESELKSAQEHVVQLALLIPPINPPERKVRATDLIRASEEKKE